jgi:hypothetical protein
VVVAAGVWAAVGSSCNAARIRVVTRPNASILC